MVEQIIIGEMLPGEENIVSKLVGNVFNEFVAPGYPVEGINNFRQAIKPEVLLQGHLRGIRFVLTAKDREKIVGVISVKNNDHISLLFVDKNYHGQNIARQLLQMAVVKCRGTNPNLKTFTVNSSPYAVPVYKKLGFQPTEPQQQTDGIIFVPMMLTF